jgi:hypothetical protein
MNSYNPDVEPGDHEDADRPKAASGLFQTGDLLVHFHGCGTVAERDCEKEMESHYRNWQSEVRKLDGKRML